MPQPYGDAGSAAPAARSQVPDAALADAAAAQASRILEAIAFLHAHPELAYDEHESAGYLAGLLEQAGLRVERAVGGMPTAFRATVAGARSGRIVGQVAVYDAVPTVRPDGTITPVHSCGHGPQAAGVVLYWLSPAARPGNGIAASSDPHHRPVLGQSEAACRRPAQSERPAAVPAPVGCSAREQP